MINDSFAAFVVRLKTDQFEVDHEEIKKGGFFDWRPMLAAWREAGSPQSGNNEKRWKFEGELPGVGEGQQELSTSMLKWLDTYEKGRGMKVKVSDAYEKGKLRVGDDGKKGELVLPGWEAVKASW